ncbi:MAG TPA: DinB family protein [Bryobacteraceae bacterium]|nr:DinB family protein [Bryobacteraceae bacterium]
MSPQPSSEIAEALDRSAAEVLAAASVPESLAGKKPAEDRWSALDCVEHLTRVEESFLERLKPAEGEAPLVDPQREAELAARMVDRTERRQAPDALRPTGRFATLSEALKEFQAVRARATRFAAEHASDLTTFTATSPRWGVMNGREVMLLLAGHSRRHAAQIRETVKELAMSPQEKSEIVDLLESGRAELVAAAAGLSEAHAKTRPAPDRWSVLECIEHVTFVEGRFLGRLEESPAGDPVAPDQAKEAAIIARALDRTNRFNAPEAIHPTGKYASVAEALAAFHAMRDRSVQFAAQQGPRLYALSTTHPVMGVLNGAEALILIASHGRRHTAQMHEAIAALA